MLPQVGWPEDYNPALAPPPQRGWVPVRLKKSSTAMRLWKTRYIARFRGVQRFESSIEFRVSARPAPPPPPVVTEPRCFNLNGNRPH